jgi:hypothetical protein
VVAVVRVVSLCWNHDAAASARALAALALIVFGWSLVFKRGAYVATHYPPNKSELSAELERTRTAVDATPVSTRDVYRKYGVVSISQQVSSTRTQIRCRSHPH